MENLILIDIPTEYTDETFRTWGKDAEPLFAESCARQLLLCTRAQYEALPSDKRVFFEQADSKQAEKQEWIFSGIEAFQHMLEIYCGLHNKNIEKDYHIANKIRVSWQIYCERLADKSEKADKEMYQFMESLFHDGKMVKTQLLDPHVKSESPFLMMTEEIKLNGKQTVVVVAEKYGITTDVCRALGRDNKKRALQIIVTHFSNQELNERMTELVCERAMKRIVSNTSAVPFAEAVDYMKTADAIVVCSPMHPDQKVADEKAKNGSNFHCYSDELKAEETIMNVWRLRKESSERTGRHDLGFLVHAKGDPSQRQKTTQHWQDFRDEFPDGVRKNIIVYDELKEGIQLRRSHNQRINADALTVIRDIAEGRAQGRRPTCLSVTIEKGVYKNVSVKLGSPQIGRRYEGPK